MLQAVYQLQNINFSEYQKNLSFLFSDLQCFTITFFFYVI